MRVADLHSFLLTLDYVRNAVAMPSVWLRRMVSKWRRFNGFGIDSPLDCDWFVCGYLRTLEIRCADSPSQTDWAVLDQDWWRLLAPILVAIRSLALARGYVIRTELPRGVCRVRPNCAP